MSRRRGPSLLRTVARTAVISGTATATSRAVSNTMDQKAMQAQQEQAAAIQAQQEMEQMKAQLATVQAMQVQAATSAPAPAAPSPAAQPDLLAQLTQLAQLKEAGALTEDEFQRAKAKLLE